MKPVQVMLDSGLLEALDATDEVQRDGRSAVIRRAIQEYLRGRRAEHIRDRYERAYADGTGLGPEYEGWAEQVAWSDE